LSNQWETTGAFLAENNNNPYCSIQKEKILWGLNANSFGSYGGWYDADIKILVEITPNN